jgi:uncharacterized protein (DUF58 family)
MPWKSPEPIAPLNPMLSPEIIKKIKKIHIKAGRTVNTIMAGQYRSVFRGAGIEFEEVREYLPGDEVKSIDWKVSARLNRPFVKRYREERELLMMLLVDMSASGEFGTGESLKRETAAEVASILAFNAIRNNDKVGAILFTEGAERYIPPKKGSAHVWRVIREIFTFSPARRGTDFQSALSYLGRVCRKRAVTFLISDFLTDADISRPLRSTARRHELIGVVVCDAGEFRLPEAGILLAEDPETGERRLFDASDRVTRRRFEERQSRSYAERMEMLRAADIDRIPITTTDSAADVLTRYFRMRERRRR